MPPVWPRPRPEIIGTKAPQAASIGASIRLTLSPTPPVECLSTTGPGRSQLQRASPERIIARVRCDALVDVHAAEEHRHREGRDLALADRCPRQAATKNCDLLGRQRAAVALGADDLLRQHQAFES